MILLQIILCIGSPAEKAGLWIVVSIVSINRKPVDRLTADGILRFKNGELFFSAENDAGISLEIMAEGKKTRFRLASDELFNGR